MLRKYIACHACGKDLVMLQWGRSIDAAEMLLPYPILFSMTCTTLCERLLPTRVFQAYALSHIASSC